MFPQSKTQMGLYLWTKIFSVFIVLTAASGYSQSPGDISGVNTTRIVCSNPYQAIGGRCLFVDNDLTGTWDEVRSFCLTINGDLVSFEDANSLGDMFKYLQLEGMTDAHYWTGANDMASEDDWVWSKNDKSVRMNTPLWGDDETRIQQPTGGLSENCGYLRHDDHFYMHDEDCKALYGTIWEEVVPVVDEVMDASINWESKEGCMYPFIQVGNSCIFVEYLAMDTYANQIIYCANHGAHMIKIDDANFLGDIYDFLMQYGLQGNELWIGATGNGNTGEWKWYDGTDVQLGTPFWGDEGISTQNPDNLFPEVCAILQPDNFFFFDDRLCVANCGVICQYEI